MIDLSNAAWHTSSYSTASGNCVEVAFVPAPWRTSSYSAASQNCVEVAPGESCTAVRDTKDRDGAVLVFPAHTWHTFLTTLRRP